MSPPAVSRGQAGSAATTRREPRIGENGRHEAGYELQFAFDSTVRISSTIATGGRIVSTLRIGRAM